MQPSFDIHDFLPSNIEDDWFNIDPTTDKYKHLISVTSPNLQETNVTSPNLHDVNITSPNLQDANITSPNLQYFQPSNLDVNPFSPNLRDIILPFPNLHDIEEIPKINSSPWSASTVEPDRNVKSLNEISPPKIKMSPWLTSITESDTSAENTKSKMLPAINKYNKTT